MMKPSRPRASSSRRKAFRRQAGGGRTSITAVVHALCHAALQGGQFSAQRVIGILDHHRDPCLGGIAFRCCQNAGYNAADIGHGLGRPRASQKLGQDGIAGNRRWGKTWSWWSWHILIKVWQNSGADGVMATRGPYTDACTTSGYRSPICTLMQTRNDRKQGRDTLETLARVVAAVGREHPEPELVLATGDLVDDGSPEAYVRLKPILLELGRPGQCDPRKP